jgi:hypothetical protein
MGESPLFPFCGESEAVEDRDGIGGEMVYSRTRQGAGKPRGSGTQAQAINPGKSKLNAAADKKVGKNSARIVNALFNSLVKDKNTTSAKLLFDLADGLINCEDPVVMNQLCSYVQTLESEQQLAADAIDEKAEMMLDEAVG